jgi:hypothetical protein
MPMGWWRPYFFWDPSEVQLLFSWARIDGIPTFILANVALAVLCALDRWLAAAASAARGDRERELRAVGLWTAQVHYGPRHCHTKHIEGEKKRDGKGKESQHSDQNINCTGMAQIVGQVQVYDRDSQLKSWIKSLNPGQPCKTHLC